MGISERVNDEEYIVRRTHYLPRHAVVRLEKATTKIRVMPLSSILQEEWISVVNHLETVGGICLPQNLKESKKKQPKFS